MSQPTEFPLVAGVVLQLEPTDEGVRVTIAETADGYRAVYSATESRDFYESQQKRGTLCNRVTEQLSDGVNAEAVRSSLEDLFTQLSANALDEDTESMLRPPIVDKMLSETDSVEVHPAETTIWKVTLTVDGMTRSIEFTANEWALGDPSKLRQRYTNEFHQRIDLQKDEWEEIVNEWTDRKTVKEREALTEKELAASNVLRNLRAKLQVYDDREKLWRDKYNAWYDDTNALGDETIPHDEPVVWVKSETLADLLEDAGREDTYLQTLSPWFVDEGVTYTTSRQRNQGYVYPFKPEEVGVEDPEKHVFFDDDEETEVEP